MNTTELIGMIAGCCTTISFIPQAYKTIRTRDTSGISVYTYILFNIGLALWLLYGLEAHQWPVIIANAVTLPFTLIILYYKIRSLRAK